MKLFFYWKFVLRFMHTCVHLDFKRSNEIEVVENGKKALKIKHLKNRDKIFKENYAKILRKVANNRIN